MNKVERIIAAVRKGANPMKVILEALKLKKSHFISYKSLDMEDNEETQEEYEHISKALKVKFGDFYFIDGEGDAYNEYDALDDEIRQNGKHVKQLSARRGILSDLHNYKGINVVLDDADGYASVCVATKDLNKLIKVAELN